VVETLRGGVPGTEAVDAADNDALSGEVVRAEFDGALDPEGVIGGRAEAGRDCRELERTQQGLVSPLLLVLPAPVPDWGARRLHTLVCSRSTARPVQIHRSYHSARAWSSVITHTSFQPTHSSTPTHLPAANFAFEPVHRTWPIPAATWTFAPMGTSVDVILAPCPSYSCSPGRMCYCASGGPNLKHGHRCQTRQSVFPDGVNTTSVHPLVTDKYTPVQLVFGNHAWCSCKTSAIRSYCCCYSPQSSCRPRSPSQRRSCSNGTARARGPTLSRSSSTVSVRLSPRYIDRHDSMAHTRPL